MVITLFLQTFKLDPIWHYQCINVHTFTCLC